MRRFTILLSLLSVMLLVIGGAHAQFGQMVICGDLSDEDCDLLNRSQTAMSELTSAEFDFDVSLSLTGLAGDDPATFSLAGDGAFSGDLSPFFTQPDDPMAMMSDPTSSLRAFAGIIDTVDARLNLNIALPEQLSEMASDVPSEIPLQLLLVDGVGYFNFDTIADIAGDDAAMLPQGWQGLDLSGALDMGISMAESQVDAMDDMEMFSMDMDMLAQLQSPEFLEQYMNLVREANNVSPSGETYAIFTTSYDFQGLISDPAVLDLIRSSAEAQGETLDEDELQEMLDETSALLEGLTYSSSIAIDVETAYIQSVTTIVNLDLSGMDDSELAETVGEASFGLSFWVNFRAFDNAAPIIAPEGATVNTVQDLMMANMGSGSAAASPVPMMTPTFTDTADSTAAPVATAMPEETMEATAEVSPPVSPPVTGTQPATTDIPATEPGILPTIAITIEPPIVPTQ